MGSEKLLRAMVAIFVILILFTGLFVILKQQVIPVMEQYQNLKHSYERLKEEYSSLADQLFSIEQGYKKLEEEYKNLRQMYLQLEESHENLRESYENLKSSYSSLVEENKRFRESYEELKSSYLDLQQSYQRLEREHEELKVNYTMLEMRASSLQKILEYYQKVYAEYLTLRERASTIIGREVRNWVEVQKVLRKPPTENVLRIVSELGLREDMNSSEKARRVMEWVMVNTRYFYDKYIVVVASRPFTGLPDYVLSADETITRGGGDCEDLAILAYTLLKQALREGEKLYLIGVSSKISGHVALLYESGGKYMIMDPAMGYASNSTIMLTIYFRNATVSITPLWLDPDFKKMLAEGCLAEITYHPERTRPYTFLDLKSAITAWLNHLKSCRSCLAENLHVDRIVNETIDRRFSSTEEFLAWMAGR